MNKEKMRNQAAELLEAQKSILNKINNNTPLKKVLEMICMAIEAQDSSMMCSVLLIDEDGKHLIHGAAPSLPKDYCDAIDGITIGPNVGSCGTAAYTGKPCIVEDICTHPNWKAFRGLAYDMYGLRSCWSTPIRSYEGNPIATFAIYNHEAKTPSLAERKLIDFSAHLVSIAVNRHLEIKELEKAGKDSTGHE